MKIRLPMLPVAFVALTAAILAVTGSAIWAEMKSDKEILEFDELTS